MRSKEKKHSTMCCVPFLYPFLLFTSIYSVSGLPSYCYHYYSEFSLNDDYNPTIYPEVNTTITDITTLYKVSEVNEMRQEIVMTIEQMLQWKEPRITLNESHSFWQMRNPIMTLQGKFVEDCLWTPKMYYISVDKISFNNPTPTEAVGSPISYHLNHTRSLTSWFHISKLTLSCGMDFSWYPFDLQVCHVIEFEMGKSTSDRSVIVYYDVEYIQNRQSDLAYSVTTETIGNIYGNHLGGAPAFIWTILLRRQLVKHVFQTYLPTFIIVFVSWLSFLVPPAAYPGRMGMLVVLVLVIINIMLKVVEMSPMTSGICGLTLWTIMCLIMITLALLEYAVILLLMRFRKEKNVPTSGKSNEDSEYSAALVESNGKVYCAIPLDHDNSHPTDEVIKKKKKSSYNIEQDAKIIQFKPWDKVAKRIDSYALIIMPLLFIVISIIYWTTYLCQGHSYPDKYVPPNSTLTPKDIMDLITASF